MNNILFFGQLKERLGCAQTSLSVPYPSSVLAVKEQLQQRGEMWLELLAQGNVLSAVNQTMANDETVINEGDEIAFFPPVTGG
ncbi:molybdopterin converting factor subunit 1 [Thalassotalea piscium]